jgi:hypothetical protein
VLVVVVTLVAVVAEEGVHGVMGDMLAGERGHCSFGDMRPREEEAVMEEANEEAKEGVGEAMLPLSCWVSILSRMGERGPWTEPDRTSCRREDTGEAAKLKRGESGVVGTGELCIPGEPHGGTTVGSW